MRNLKIYNGGREYSLGKQGEKIPDISLKKKKLITSVEMRRSRISLVPNFANAMNKRKRRQINNVVLMSVHHPWAWIRRKILKENGQLKEEIEKLQAFINNLSEQQIQSAKQKNEING